MRESIPGLDEIPGIFREREVLSIREGSITSFSESILSCHAALYRYARSLCGEPGEADEILQEAYKRALAAKREPAPPTVEAIRPWMFTILRNVWLNERRRQSRLQETWIDEADEIAGPESPELLIRRKLLVSEVREAVDSLPVLWREIVVMREIEELSYAEIAEILGCPIGTVMSRLARARAALRQLLSSRVPVSREVHS